MRCFRLFLTISTLIMIACVVAISCVDSDNRRPVVTVTIPPQKYFVEQIAGDKLDVRTLLSNGADPETYDPTVTNMMNLDKSIAFLRLGNVGFEDAIIGKISTVNPELPIYDTSRGIEIITGTHAHHPEGAPEHDDEPDPHTWNSVRNAKTIANNILHALSDVDPGNAKYYERRTRAFVAHLDSLDKAIAARMNAAGNPSFIVWHPSLSYFARDYGLRQIVVGSENKEPSALAMKEAITTARESDAKVFFFQKDVDNRRLESLNSAIDAVEVPFNPLSADWETEIMNITDALTAQ